MEAIDVFWHLLNFVAPAAVLAVLLPLAGRWAGGRGARLAWWKQILVQFFLGLGTLVAGLVLTGHDGKMWTYTALVLVAGTCQWALSRGWRR